MNTETHYSPDLNLILELLGVEGTVEDVLRIKAVSVKLGYVNSSTRVLALIESDMPLRVEEMRAFSLKLLDEMPEYAGTRTAVVARTVGVTAGTMLVSKELSDKLSIQVFSTLEYALNFLGATMEEIESAFPAQRHLLKRFKD